MSVPSTAAGRRVEEETHQGQDNGECTTQLPDFPSPTDSNNFIGTVLAEMPGF